MKIYILLQFLLTFYLINRIEAFDNPFDTRAYATIEAKNIAHGVMDNTETEKMEEV